MASNKRLIAAGAAAGGAGALDPLQNFETVTYTGNGGTQKITGYIRKGAAFKDYTSYIQTALPSNSIYALSFWLYFESGVTTGTTFGTDVSSGAGDIVTELGTNGSFSITIQNKRRSLNAGALGSTGWKHIAYSSDQTLYINGVNQTGGATGTESNPSANLLIGNWNGSLPSWGGFNSKLDQIRVFNRNLILSEVTTLYNETYDSSTKSTTDIFGDGSGVALYELDEDANDTGTTPYGTGAIDSGQSADFNGSSEAYNNTSVASNLTGDYSFGFYVKFDSLPTEGGLMGIYTPNTVNGTTLSFANGNLLLNCGNSQTATSISSSFWEVNKWYHIAVTHDNGGDVKLYANGILLETLPTTSTTIQSGSSLILGRSSRTSSGSYNYVQRLNGQMDEVRIYNDVLTETEVGYLAANDSVNIPTGNLIAHYKLDGNGNDETSNNHNLTWSGTELYSTNAEFPLVQYNGTPTNINFLGMAFQPDLVWVKSRSVAFNNMLTDSINGGGNFLIANTTAALDSNSSAPTFDSNGFTLGGGNSNWNNSPYTYVAWCWKAGGAAVTDSSTGTLTANISANTAAGFSIVNYTGNQTSGATFPHGLDSAAEMVIIKNKSASTYWFVYHKDLSTNYNVYLNTADSQQADNQMFGADANVVTVGSSISVNSSTTDSMIAYCFHSVDGYQKVGSYTGNTSTLPSVDLGFSPRFVMIKEATDTGSWLIYDSVRPSDPVTQNDKILFANDSSAESTSAGNVLNFTSTGFDIEAGSSELNTNGNTYIYLAIA